MVAVLLDEDTFDDFVGHGFLVDVLKEDSRVQRFGTGKFNQRAKQIIVLPCVSLIVK